MGPVLNDFSVVKERAKRENALQETKQQSDSGSLLTKEDRSPMPGKYEAIIAQVNQDENTAIRDA